jgi:hypothetical protein
MNSVCLNFFLTSVPLPDCGAALTVRACVCVTCLSRDFVLLHDRFGAKFRVFSKIRFSRSASSAPYMIHSITSQFNCALVITKVATRFDINLVFVNLKVENNYNFLGQLMSESKYGYGLRSSH